MEITFTEWLKQWEGEENPFGDLARDVAADECWPEDGITLRHFYNHLRQHGACPNDLRTLVHAWVQFDLKHPKTCHDCGACEGELHSLGCDMEICPVCHKQYITCAHSEQVFSDEERIAFWVFPNMCARCGKLWPKALHVSDEEWQSVVPPDHWKDMICWSCYNYMKVQTRERNWQRLRTFWKKSRIG